VHEPTDRGAARSHELVDVPDESAWIAQPGEPFTLGLESLIRDWFDDTGAEFDQTIEDHRRFKLVGDPGRQDLV